MKPKQYNKQEMLILSVLLGLGISPLLKAQVTPEEVVASDRKLAKLNNSVTLQDGIFYPKGETEGRNFLNGSWHEGMDPTTVIWNSALESEHEGTYKILLEALDQGLATLFQGIPGVLMHEVLQSDQEKAQFMADIENGSAELDQLAVGPGNVVMLSSMDSVLQSDPAYAIELLESTLVGLEAGHHTSSEENILYSILSAGDQNLNTDPIDLTGTGITQTRFLEAIGIGHPMYNNLSQYTAKWIFDH